MDKLLEKFMRTLIEDFKDYQIEWLTSHNDIEFCPEEEELIVQFLKDTANIYMMEHSE